ncbi:hypothetical protein MNBD_ALPHA07-2321 [hydrothermal vent metagenome]|uniref:Uncharacterized protein n=1 Tax=hydrothermal vent metagenome TaxID=652676 RepID=A0A3B0RK40_9ZZZZ
MTAARPLNTKPPEDAVVVISASETPGSTALINALCNSPRRLSVVLVAATPENAITLAGQFPLAYVHQPGPGLLAARLRARVILRLDPVANPQQIITRAIRRGMPVFGLDTTKPLSLKALSPSAAEGLPETGDAQALADHLITAMGFERGDGPVQGGIARWAQRLMHGRTRPLLAPLIRRLDSPKALAARLNTPQTIMCLGNGPTSADPRLESLAHDALFRVNHQWMQGGYMTKPDMIFAGVKRSMRAAGSALIGVASARKEEALLGARILTPWHGRLRYVVVEEIADLGDALRGHPRPTTGAVMLAAAIALTPKRLIIAGMDMFADKAGAYPGRHDAVNAYSAAHDRQTDANFIRNHLARYEGEIMTLSPAFSRLAHSVADPRFTLAKPPQA